MVNLKWLTDKIVTFLGSIERIGIKSNKYKNLIKEIFLNWDEFVEKFDKNTLQNYSNNLKKF
jgi:hypothetical protein